MAPRWTPPKSIEIGSPSDAPPRLGEPLGTREIPQDAFSELLERLAREHGREVEALRQENKALRRRSAFLELKHRAVASKGEHNLKGQCMNPDATCAWVEDMDLPGSLKEPETMPSGCLQLEDSFSSDELKDELDRTVTTSVPSNGASSICREDVRKKSSTRQRQSLDCPDDPFRRGSSATMPSPGQGSGFEARPIWTELMDPDRGFGSFSPSTSGLRHKHHNKAPTATKTLTLESLISKLNTQGGRGGRSCRLVQYPNSPSRLLWDFAGGALILYDLFWTPVQLCFEPESTSFIRAMDWVTLLFWTMNVPASFFVGFVKNGNTIMKPSKIARNYASTWLVVDLVVIVPDWIFTVVQFLSGTANTGSDGVRLLRSFRLIRLVRLLRLLKLRRIFQHIDDATNSEFVSIVSNILKMLCILVVINHVIGCIWYFIGNHWASSIGDTWVKAHHFEEEGWGYQYTTAVHWSITQFTPASMDVQPHNLLERSFTIFVVLFALVGFSYVVGSITGSLTQLRSMQEDAAKQFWVLRRYLKQEKVSHKTAIRIQRYIEHRVQCQSEKIPQKKVVLLQLLSEQLTMELSCEIVLPSLAIHPLLKRLDSVTKVTIYRIANTATKTKSLAQNDFHFHKREVALSMSIVTEGVLQYYRSTSKNLKVNERVDKAEDWIAEPVLWTAQWKHLGDLQAMTEVELLHVDPVAFGNAIKLNPDAIKIANRYAAKFLEWLNDVYVNKNDSLSDVSQGEDVSEMLESFLEEPPQQQQIIPDARFSARERVEHTLGFARNFRTQRSI